MVSTIYPRICARVSADEVWIGGLLGFCYFPEKKPTAELRTLDGCVNLAGSMPGGETRAYNLGATAVHEAGHWYVYQNVHIDLY